MKTLNRADIPEDFSYYRTGSCVFYEYYQHYYTGFTERIGTGYEYIKADRILGTRLYSVIAEKIDIEPTHESLASIGIHHALVYWAPMRKIEKPLGWIRLP